MQPQNTNPNLIPGEKLIYERANGIIYARYAKPKYRHIGRWIIGGAVDGFIPGTGMPKPEEWRDFIQCEPDWDTMQKHETLLNKYTEYLELQQKYVVWEQLNATRKL